MIELLRVGRGQRYHTMARNDDLLLIKSSFAVSAVSVPFKDKALTPQKTDINQIDTLTAWLLS